MSDVTEAVAQDQVAESLLGPEPTQEVAEQTQTGPEAAEQTEQVFEKTEEGQEQFTEESPDDWLPSEQDKVFPQEVYSKYAQRYGFSEEQASDPLIQHLLHDKINSDIHIRQQQELQQQQEFQIEPEPEPTQQQTQQPVTFEQHIANMNQWVQQNTDPRVANMFASEFMKAFGVNDAVKPEMAQALTRTFSTFGLNLIQTALPQMLAPMLDSVLPGLSSMYYSGNRAQSWDSVRNSSPDYANLPAYGSREFMELCARVDSEFPALTEMGIQMQNAGGGELYGPAAQKFYTTLARVAANLDKPQVNPDALLQAARAGAATARRGQVRKDAGNLGAGQSKGLNNNRAVKSQFQTNQDIFDDDAMAIWQKEHGRI